MIDQASPALAAPEGEPAAGGGGLWVGDPGTLPMAVRRVIVRLLHGPYLSGERDRNLWRTLVGNEGVIRSRLADCLLDLVVDLNSEVAFLRDATPDDEPSPQVIRSVPLTFIQTAMMLTLRRALLKADRSERVFVGLDELTDQLEVYRAGQALDGPAFAKRVGAAWTRMHDLGLLRRGEAEDRSEIAPVLRIVFGPNELSELVAEYRRIAAGGAAAPAEEDDSDQPLPDAAPGLPAGSGVGAGAGGGVSGIGGREGGGL
ncbi:MAG: DUF4194 domain-containing protein [Bifidobacteriaceae bacterium]|jgi:hypothetical protein|nr:DUF4194 domain-containing protein [Bifidobacteriaceae bacterium]